MNPMHPIEIIGSPEEVAELIVCMCSPKASFVTGASLQLMEGFLQSEYILAQCLLTPKITSLP
jgi:NAD(P)-dependent dehydrogenase (short-subunit alcohol dehydrogenase family)